MTLVGRLVLAAAIALNVGSAAAVPPAEKCEAGKLNQAGKYGFCRVKAEAKAVKTGAAPDYAKCDANFGAKWIEIENKGGTQCPTSGDHAVIGLVISDHADDVATALNGGLLPGRGQRLRTGQTTCYDTVGAVIACAGTGQDGELQKGLQLSFTDNGDGTIWDHRTGLMWEKLSDDGSIHDWDGSYTWSNAFAVKIATLNSTMFAGYGDWRLPNVNELQSLANYSGVVPSVHAPFHTGCVAGCTVLTCSCTHPVPFPVYWSSTTLHPIGLFVDQAFDVHFESGHVNTSQKSESHRVRAVRGGV